MSSISMLCDSIFNNTHPELLSLHQQVEEFQTIYQSDVEAISNNLIEQYSYNQEKLDESIISDESNLNEPILNNEQIDKFKKIYYKNKIEDNEKAQYKKLQTTVYCKEICFQNLVFHEHAILTYQKFQNLSNNEKDLFLFGILSATTRQKTTTTGQKHSRLATHFIQQEISPRIHKLTRKISNFAISFEPILNVLTFIINYANIHGLPSPDTLPITFLPANKSYSSLYQLYISAIENQNQNIFHLSTFWRIWNKYIPKIKFLSPRSDLCYKSKINLQQLSNFSNFSRSNEPNSLKVENHISWDYAEQIKIPYSSQQEGTIYFKSSYNIQLFGICEDAFPIQKNYLIKEEESIGKCANAVISLIPRRKEALIKKLRKMRTKTDLLYRPSSLEEK
ncbi:7064_t:CDS:2 [Cetraspora pellucida]|uniref:7064_t:CDS:1 n=1 Tax=Cetraspora pellucida TaxID=1433469 RepID=A0A9N8Z1Q4_9GLOM|nr:7064_t:CDS:2 [Cetraspora pellucida]